MIGNNYIKRILGFNDQYAERHEVHARVAALLPEMAADKEFWFSVFRMNLSDKGYLNRKWTMYEIPFFYVYETNDFYLKVHLFCALETGETNVLASAIHHHNNYMLTTCAAFGSGYETFLFEKNPVTNEQTKEVNLRIAKRFRQRDQKVHLIDAWEPHCVVNPETFSATLNFWSPDKKRKTDQLRSHPLLKAIKMPLRKLIFMLGMTRKFGIAEQNTYQWYPKDGKFIGVLEDDFFSVTRQQAGPEVDDYSVQSIFYFMQKMGFSDVDFLTKMLSNPDVPRYYHKWINMMIDGKEIPVTYAKASINVPGGRITIEDVLQADANSRH